MANRKLSDFCPEFRTFPQIDLDRIGLVTAAPIRSTDAYAYGHLIDSDLFFTGGAAQKSYMLGLIGTRPVGSPATGDSNDAFLRISGSNYAANDANFIWRGINAALANRAGGTMGRMEHALGVQNKVGGTVPYLVGLTITAENYGTCATEFGGLDLVLKNEAAVATSEYGVRVRNLNNSLATAVGAAFLVSDTGANIGFGYGMDLNGATIQTAEHRLSHGATISNLVNGTMALTSTTAELIGGASVPALKLTGAGSKSAAAYAATGTAWADGATPAFAADQMYARVYIGTTVYRLPLWADA